MHATTNSFLVLLLITIPLTLQLSILELWNVKNSFPASLLHSLNFYLDDNNLCTSSVSKH